MQMNLQSNETKNIVPDKHKCLLEEEQMYQYLLPIFATQTLYQ
jgi:hypothetical protein